MLSVSAWLDAAAASVVEGIVNATKDAPVNVREAIPHPSQVDLAIVARVADMLTPAEVRSVRKSA